MNLTFFSQFQITTLREHATILTETWENFNKTRVLILNLSLNVLAELQATLSFIQEEQNGIWYSDCAEHKFKTALWQ